LALDSKQNEKLLSSINTIIMKMRSFLFAIATLLLSGLGNTAQAQRIAYIDMDRILNSITEYQQAQEELDKIASQWRQEIALEYDNIKSQYNRYQAEQVLLSDQERKKYEDEIIAKEQEVRELQKRKFGPEGELFKKRQELVEPIQAQVFQAITDYADDQGYDFIFDKASSSGMIFANAKYDVTDKILQKLGN
jgi:outer membrane protein